MKNLLIATLLLCMTITSKPLYSQGNPEDQYRQMGGVVGLTEICFGTKDLETVFFNRLEMFFTPVQKWGGLCLNYCTFISNLMK